MTSKEKCIIETILADVGLESICTGGNDDDQRTKTEGVVKTSR